jgi:hypothetical protein
MKGGIPKNAGPPNVKEKVPLVVEQCALVKNNPAFKWELYKGGDNRDDFIRNSVDKDWCIMADIKAAKPTEGKLLTGMKVTWCNFACFTFKSIFCAGHGVGALCVAFATQWDDAPKAQAR